MMALNLLQNPCRFHNDVPLCSREKIRNFMNITNMRSNESALEQLALVPSTPYRSIELSVFSALLFLGRPSGTPRQRNSCTIAACW